MGPIFYFQNQESDRLMSDCNNDLSRVSAKVPYIFALNIDRATLVLTFQRIGECLESKKTRV